MEKQTIVEKKLDTKKNVLEYIEAVKLGREDYTEEELTKQYQYIEACIDTMAKSIKANTVLYLKQTLNAQLGKYVKGLEKPKEDIFIAFFKEAYPDGKRRKEFTYVLANPQKMSEEQILHTLKYINAYCLRGNKLNIEEKQAILQRIEFIVCRGNLKYINQIRSLEGMRKNIAFEIEKIGKGYFLAEKGKMTNKK